MMKDSKELVYLSLEKRRQRKDMITVLKYVKGNCKKERNKTFTISIVLRTISHKFKVLLRKF